MGEGRRGREPRGLCAFMLLRPTGRRSPGTMTLIPVTFYSRGGEGAGGWQLVHAAHLLPRFYVNFGGTRWAVTWCGRR